MRRALILGCLCLTAATPAEPPNRDFWEKLARFHEHYDKFVRAYMGCPRSAITIDQCKPDLGTFDWTEFHHAMKDAKPLFGLESAKQ